MLSEFDLIKKYFVRARPARAPLGIGDDCALLAPSPGMQLAVSSDMLVEGRHFLPGADARKLGHKCLAVNLSDLAAMGAKPVAFTLALALPASDEHWLEPFAQGLFELADLHGCELVGGDTTKGPLTISITVFGEVAPGRALRRAAAQAGDDVWISGTLGDARLALSGYLGERALDPADLDAAAVRMHEPQPRVALGMALASSEGAVEGDMVARAALDISDGLVGDIGHILKASGVGATLEVDALPAGAVLARQPLALRREFTAAGGDDYELCFTAPRAHREAVAQAARRSGTAVTRVGTIDSRPGLRWTDASGAPVTLSLAGFDHFASS